MLPWFLLARGFVQADALACRFSEGRGEVCTITTSCTWSNDDMVWDQCAQLSALWTERTEMARFLRLPLRISTGRNELAVISDALLNRETLGFKAGTIASDCNSILRFPSENRALSAECPCDLTLVKENRSDCDVRFWGAHSLEVSLCPSAWFCQSQAEWEILGSALGSAPEGAPRNRGAPESALEDCGALSGALPAPQSSCSRQHPPSSTMISQSTRGSTSQSSSKDLSFGTLVTGGWERI